MIIPSVAFVVNDGSAKTSGWVDSGPCDGNGGQMNQENRESNRKRGQYLRHRDQMIFIRNNQMQQKNWNLLTRSVYLFGDNN